ncbi:MAG: YdcF family protein [Alphaproteobacteria bacterium]|nr:YdcF family protein [Alphaproteobacteria bacterium]
MILLLRPAAWTGGLLGFVATLPTEPDAPERKTDAVVVLTGGADRVTEGVRLLGEGKAPVLFVSGVGEGVTVARLLELAGQGTNSGLACCIELGRAAQDTVGNAAETAAWAASRKARSLRIVTAAYHLPRALHLLRRSAPDVEMLAHPVVPETLKLEEWWRWPGTLEVLLGAYHKFLLALTLDRLGEWYRSVKDGG